MEYGYPILETCRHNNGRAFYKYSEHPINEETGLIDVGIRHGRYVENYHGERGIRYFHNYQHGTRVGMNWEFHEPDDNREDGGNHPKVMTSYEQGGHITTEFYVSGEIRTEEFTPETKGHDGHWAKSYSHAGFVTNYNWVDGNYKYSVDYKTGRPTVMRIFDMVERIGWEIKWYNNHLVHVAHHLMHQWSTSFEGSPHGLLLTYDKKKRMYDLSFWDDDERVTREVVGQCMDPMNITHAEEVMMTMYFDQHFRTQIPEHVRAEVDNLIEQDKILVT